MQGEAGKPEKPGESEKPGKETPKPDKETPKGEKKASTGENRARAESNRRMLRIGIVALALIVGVVAWVATRGGDSADSTPAASGKEAEIVNLAQLEEFAAAAGHPVYWVGTVPGKELEASETATGDVQIRYLEEGTEAGGGPAGVLTIGSYPLPDPGAAVKAFAGRSGSVVRHASDGREVVTSVEKPSSVYFASPDNSVQVEVYDPAYKRAMGLALSDRVQPVG